MQATVSSGLVPESHTPEQLTVLVLTPSPHWVSQSDQYPTIQSEQGPKLQLITVGGWEYLEQFFTHVTDLK